MLSRLRYASAAQPVSDATAMIDGLTDMRIRNAALVTALLKLGQPLKVTPHGVFKAAEHDINVTRDADGFVIALVPNKRN